MAERHKEFLIKILDALRECKDPVGYIIQLYNEEQLELDDIQVLS